MHRQERNKLMSPANNNMQWMELRAAADAELYTKKTEL